MRSKTKLKLQKLIVYNHLYCIFIINLHATSTVHPALLLYALVHARDGTPLRRWAREHTCTFMCACDECKQGDEANACGTHAKCVQERCKLSTGRVLAVNRRSLANWLAGDVSSDSASCISTVSYCQKFYITSRKQALLQTRTMVLTHLTVKSSYRYTHLPAPQGGPTHTCS